jgi:hypothetical protein
MIPTGKGAGWVGLRASLDIVATRKILLCWQLNPGYPAHSPVTILTELSNISILIEAFEVK